MSNRGVCVGAIFVAQHEVDNTCRRARVSTASDQPIVLGHTHLTTVIRLVYA